MSRPAVPRGNGFDPPPPAYQLDATSPRWGLLTPDEQQAALAGIGDRPVLLVVSASDALAGCLGDARRAPTGAEWECHRDRLRAVKSAVFEGTLRGWGDDEIRRRLRPALTARLVLLHVPPADAAAMSGEAVEHLLLWRAAGEVPPPRLGRYMPDWPAEWRFAAYGNGRTAERDAAQAAWAAGHTLLRAAEGLAVRARLDDELRAFDTGPPPSEFVAAAGRHAEQADPLAPPTPLRTPEAAAEHVVGTVSLTQALVDTARRAAGGDALFTAADLGEVAGRHMERISARLSGNAIDERLLLRYCGVPAEFPPVVGRTAHEAALELCRRVLVGVRMGVRLDEPFSVEAMTRGPWEGCEVAPGLVALVADAPDLCAAFDDLAAQRLTAAVELEAAREASRLAAPEAGVRAAAAAPQAPDSPATARGRRGRIAGSPDFDRNVAEAIIGGITVQHLAKEYDMTEREIFLAAKRHNEKCRERASPRRRK